MKFWHIQLHPDDRRNFTIDVIQNLLIQKKVIGLGEWEDGESKREQFFDLMMIGDIVAVKQGGTPIALVQVVGNAYFEKNTNKELDWFPNRRKIEILDFYKDEYNFTIPQTRGTLSICNDLNASTSKIIINWYKKITREKLMGNIKITPDRKNEIKTLWLDFKGKYSDNDKADIESKVNDLIDSWNKYKSKIIGGTISLDDYTNTVNNDTALMPGGYLCNFLETTTKMLFGSSKPGNAIRYEVKLNDDNKSYTIGAKNPNETRDSAELKFNQDIKPLLENIVAADDLYERIDIVETTSYAAKQILRKLAGLDYLGDFLFIYSNEMVDTLHDQFINSDETKNLAKCYEIRAVANELLSINKNDPVESVMLSRFLWKFANSQSIADSDTPNVILYGAPGTGKTYEVKNNLAFICQNDRSRYEFVQFHPSFTYEDFIEGIKPKGVTNDGNIKFELVDGVFKKFCKRAKENPDKDYYFVVDEINRANLSSVFGEALLCLEKDYRHDPAINDDSTLIKTQYSTLIEDMINENPSNESLAYHLKDGNVYFGIPKNLYFIGMMNDVDKSIDAFDLALRRRFKWIRKDCDYDVVEHETKFRNGDAFDNIKYYKKSCADLNSYICNDLGLGTSYEFGHSFFMKMSSIASARIISAKNMSSLFELHLRPTLKEYLRSMFAESELDNKLDEALDKFQKSIKR